MQSAEPGMAGNARIAALRRACPDYGAAMPIAGDGKRTMPDARGKAGRKPKHGRYTKAAIKSRREVRELLRAVRELIDT